MKFLFCLLFLMGHILCWSSNAATTDNGVFVIYKDDFDLVQDLEKSAFSSFERNDYKSAYKYELEAFNVLSQKTPIDSAQYAEVSHNLGVFALYVDEFDIFQTKLQKAIEIKESIYGQSIDYYWSLEVYAEGLFFYGRKLSFPDNIPLYNLSIETYQQIPDYYLKENYINTLTKLSEAYSNINIKKSIEIEHNIWGLLRSYYPQMDTIQTISRLAQYYCDDENYSQSLKYCDILLERLKDISNTNPDFFVFNKLAASVNVKSGNISTGIEYAKKAQESAEIIYGKESSQYAEMTNNMGTYYLYSKNDALGIKYLKEAYDLNHYYGLNLAGAYNRINELDSCYIYLREYWNNEKNNLKETLLKLEGKDKFAYFSSSSTYYRLNSPLFYTLQHLEHKGLRCLAYDCIVYNRNLLLNCSTARGSRSSYMFGNWEEVKTILHENEVSVEVWSPVADTYFNTDSIYVFVLRNTWDSPKCVCLDRNKVRSTLNGDFKADSTITNPLYEFIWKDIIECAEIKKNESLYITLDDFLPLYPLEITINPEGEYLCDVYNINRISNPLEIKRMNDVFSIRDAVLYGGLIYDEKDIDEYSLKQNLQNQDTRSKSLYLPWTKREVDSISTKLSKANINVIKCCGHDGTTSSIKNLSNYSPTIIHLATHGRLETPESKEYEDYFDYYIQCMQRSYLLLSDCLDENNEINPNGILTCDDIQNLNLSNTNLLVLSACKSGVGFPTMDGLTGLQRAFKLSGVQTIIMSLWDVDDLASSFFMKVFYEGLVDKKSKREAFIRAQKLTREKFEDPYYWAAFIMLD